MSVVRTMGGRLLAAITMIAVVGAAGLATIGGAGAAAASPSGVDGDVVLGVDSQSTSFVTGVSTSGVVGFHAVSSYQSGYGVIGEGNYGVQGSGTTVGVYGYSANTGTGLIGDNPGSGTGVYGQSSSGVGVSANSSGGTALQVYGTATFSFSGTVGIKTGKSSVTVTTTLTANSFVLATLQTFKAGFWVTAAVPNVGKGTLTIYLNKAATSKLRVAWFVVN